MWLLLNLHLLPSSPSSSSSFASFLLNILTLLLPPLSSSLKILAMTNGTEKSTNGTEKASLPDGYNSILPGNVTGVELGVVTGQLTGTIMGLLPTLMENQTEAAKAQLGNQVKKEVERFFGELKVGGGGGGQKNESEEKVEEKKDACGSRPCNPKAVCISIGEYFQETMVHSKVSGVTASASAHLFIFSCVICSVIVSHRQSSVINHHQSSAIIYQSSAIIQKGKSWKIIKIMKNQSSANSRQCRPIL